MIRDLQSSAKRFMKRNFEDVCRTEDFQELSVEDVEDLISSDNIYVQTEETVVEAIQLWLSKDTNLRQQHVQRLIQHVKLTNCCVIQIRTTESISCKNCCQYKIISKLLTIFLNLWNYIASYFNDVLFHVHNPQDFVSHNCICC